MSSENAEARTASAARIASVASFVVGVLLALSSVLLYLNARSIVESTLVPNDKWPYTATAEGLRSLNSISSVGGVAAVILVATGFFLRRSSSR